jgi:hypothetical protein
VPLKQGGSKATAAGRLAKPLTGKNNQTEASMNNNHNEMINIQDYQNT